MTMPSTKQLQGVLNASSQICHIFPGDFISATIILLTFLASEFLAVILHWLFSQQVFRFFYVSFSFQAATGMEFHFMPQSVSITT